MQIWTEPTPNPATLKFLTGAAVMPSGTANFPTPESAGRSPLAEALFRIDGVTGVFLGADFITVAKADEADWDALEPALTAAIADHFANGRPVLTAAGEDETAAEDGADGEIVAQIRELLDTRVRPAVAMDGGDIVFQGYEDGVVYLYMQGACAGCPSSTATLKMGIENMLKHYIPEVVEVRAAM
ncbi:MAG: NifU family protein [Alphaproteobacteria bacterium]|nr:NifU family protein [Alphaproteobacteria bacterium]